MSENPWLHGELVNEGKLWDQVTSRIDALGDNADWVNITNVNSGYEITAWQFCVKVNCLIVRGSLHRSTGNVTLNDTIFAFPAGITLSSSLYDIPFRSNGGSGHMSVSTAGVAKIAQVTNAGPDIVPAQVLLPLN